MFWSLEGTVVSCLNWAFSTMKGKYIPQEFQNIKMLQFKICANTAC